MNSVSRLVLTVSLSVVPCGAAVADWERGIAAYRSEDYAAAEAEFRAEVAARPSFAGAHFMLGDTLRRSGKAEKAEEALASLRRAVELAPGEPLHALGLGQALVDGQQYEEAITLLETLEMEQLDAAQRRARALLLADGEMALGQPEKALAALAADLAAADADPKLQRRLGQALRGLDRKEEALDAFRRAFELDPNETGSCASAINLAFELARGAEGDARDGYYARAAALAVGLADARQRPEDFRLAGRSLLLVRQPRPALPWVEKALEVTPDDPELHYLRGWALRCLGSTDAAARSLRAALAHAPDAELKTRVHGQLARIAEGRFDLEEAARQHRLAGDSQRAQQLEELRSSFRTSLDRLGDLRRQIDDVNARTTQLEALGQTEAAAQVRARVSVLEEEAAAIEANLDEVRKALRGSADCG